MQYYVYRQVCIPPTEVLRILVDREKKNNPKCMSMAEMDKSCIQCFHFFLLRKSKSCLLLISTGAEDHDSKMHHSKLF